MEEKNIWESCESGIKLPKGFPSYLPTSHSSLPGILNFKFRGVKREPDLLSKQEWPSSWASFQFTLVGKLCIAFSSNRKCWEWWWPSFLSDPRDGYANGMGLPLNFCGFIIRAHYAIQYPLLSSSGGYTRGDSPYFLRAFPECHLPVSSPCHHHHETEADGGIGREGRKQILDALLKLILNTFLHCVPCLTGMQIQNDKIPTGPLR